jgi:hypothetical protein
MSSVPRKAPQSQAQTPQTQPLLPGAASDPRQRATDMARRLDMTGRRVLIAAAQPVLLNAPEPYLPASPEDAHIAHWLAQTPLGLLVSEWAGYAMVYRLTYLGRLVVSAFMTDYLLLVALGGEHGRR